MTNKLEAMLEGERRGILPPDKQAILDEGRRRGLIPALEGQAQIAPSEPTGPSLKPFTREDLRETIEKSAPIALGGAGALAGLSLGRNLLSKALFSGIGGAAGEEIGQIGAGEEFDPTRAAIAAGTGAVGGVAVDALTDIARPGLTKLINRLSPGDVDLPQAKVDITAGLQKARQTAKQSADDAWSLVEDSTGVFNQPGVGLYVRENVRSSIDEITDPTVADWAQGLLNRSIPDRVGTQHQTLRDLAGYRTALNRAYSNDPAKNRAIGIMRDALDDNIADVTKSALYKGDPEDALKIRRAKDLTKEFKNTWDDNRTIQQLSADNANPDDAIRFLFNQNAIARNKDAIKVLSTIEDKAPETFDVLQKAAFKRIVTDPKTGELKSPDKIAKFISDMNLNHNQLSKKVFKKDWEKIRSMGTQIARADDLGPIERLMKKYSLTQANLMTAGMVATGGGSLWAAFGGGGGKQ